MNLWIMINWINCFHWINNCRLNGWLVGQPEINYKWWSELGHGGLLSCLYNNPSITNFNTPTPALNRFILDHFNLENFDCPVTLWFILIARKSFDYECIPDGLLMVISQTVTVLSCIDPLVEICLTEIIWLCSLLTIWLWRYLREVI